MMSTFFQNMYQNAIGIMTYIPGKMNDYFLSISHIFLTVDHNLIVLIFLTLLLFLLLWYILIRKVQSKDITIPSLRTFSVIVPGDDKPRFRKRDKIRYYATRLNRRFQDLTNKLQNIKSKDQKQKLMSLFAKKVLSLKEQSPKLIKRSLPDTFLEPDVEEDDNMLPEEFQLMLDSIRVFGYLEKNFLAEFCKNIECIKLKASEFLFKKGDIDDNVFVVKSGKIRVYIEENDTRMTIREVQRGGNIYSILSILDVIVGHTQPYKTVNAQAICDSEVLRLKANSFVEMFNKSPEAMVRVVQLIAMRLQRVTFLSLHHYLGLTSELINKESLAVPDSLVIKLSKSMPQLVNTSLIRQLSAGLELNENRAEKKIFFNSDQNDNNSVSSHGSSTDSKKGSKRRGRSHSPQPMKNKNKKFSKSKKIVQNKDVSATSNVASLKHTSMIDRKKGVKHDAEEHQKTKINDQILHVKVKEGKELEYGEIPAGATGTGFRNSFQRRSSMKERKRKISSTVPNTSNAIPNTSNTILNTSNTIPNTSNASTTTSHIFKDNHVTTLNNESKPRPRVQSLVPNNEKKSRTNIETKYSTTDLLEAAKGDIGKILGLKDLTVLSKLKISIVPEGTSLVKEGEEETDVFFVVTGELHALQHSVINQTSKMSSLFITHPGELCGVEPIITTEASFYTIRTIIPARVVVLDRGMLYGLIKDHPDILLKLSNLLVRRMSPFLRQIDFALEWTSIKAGFPLYKATDDPKNVYIILNGRFRQIQIRNDGSREIVNELGRGELMGFVEVLCNQPRATTVMAIRDSEVAQIPSGLLSWVKYKAPQVVTRLIQLLADKLMVSMSNSSGSIPKHSLVKGPVGTMANLKTIAIVANSPDVPLEAFTLELQHSMMNIGSSVRLTSTIINKRLGGKALDPMNEYRMLSWLSQQEDLHKMVFYVADNQSNSIWTKRCIRQADCVVIVALANSDPKLSLIEQGIESDQTKVSKILVLLYNMDTAYPPVGKTSEWLNLRAWITHHYHVRVPNRVLSSVRRKRDRLVELYKRVFEKETPNPHADMTRLARYLTGTSIGLVLGGGGARGCSHVGVIRAMHEAGIPIDMIGGTSIGAFMGALWAEETRVTQFTQRARAYSRDMSSVWKMVLDLTYSPVSIFSGKAFNTALETVFQDRQIEDLWIPYFCITTDITNSRMRSHTNGSIWRFVRASMSLSGYLPPLCHPDDGSLLLDGGYVNNLPADVMHDMGPEHIFAVDVGSHDDTDLSNYGDWLSGGKLLYKKISRNPLKVLNLTEIQSRLAFVSCVRQMEQVKESGICEYMRPPIEKYKTLQFGSFDEIQEVGYQFTKAKIADWQTDDSIIHFSRGQLQWINVMGQFTTFPTQRKLTKTKYNARDFVLGSSSLDVYKRNFVDLAELVSRIGPEVHSYYETDNEDDDLYDLTKIKMENDNESGEVEILFRPRIPLRKSDNNTKYAKKSSKDATDQVNMNSIMLKDTESTNIKSSDKFDDGYDEDLEDDDNFGETASDPESFYRVLVNTHKRRHRRSSLNRLHKSVTFSPSFGLL